MPLAVRRDQGPGSLGRARERDHVVGGFFVSLPFGAVAPVFLGQLPALVRVVPAGEEAPLLLVLVDVEPEFHEQGPVGGQLCLEFADFRVGSAPCRHRREAFDALHQDPAVPAPVEDRDASVLRETAPEAPEVVVPALLVGRRRDAVDPVAARVQRRDGPPDGSALAAGVPSLEDEDDRQPAPQALGGEPVEVTAQALHRRRVGPAGDGACQVDRRERRCRAFGGRGRGRRRVSGQAHLERLAQRLQHVERAAPGVAAVDDMPRRRRRAGARDDALGGLDEPVVAVPVAPVPLADPPVVPRMLLEGLQALPLCVAAEMHPELEDQRAVVGQHALERRNAREPLVQAVTPDASVRAVH